MNIWEQTNKQKQIKQFSAIKIILCVILLYKYYIKSIL